MDNSGKEKEAMQLMAEADKKVKSSGSFLGGMFGWEYFTVPAPQLSYVYSNIAHVSYSRFDIKQSVNPLAN